MKNTLALGLAAASSFILVFSGQSARAQQAEYLQTAQNQLQGQMQGQMPGQFQQAYPVMDQNQYAAQQYAMQQAWIQK
ncbi:MAG: hypothetical protein JSS86_17150, partial [Cyanobacteria bacterium SZAS LIN-2]|nr:hypothetical protein [Cyanobacteria bacterium SZAS LIN-2]